MDWQAPDAINPDITPPLIPLVISAAQLHEARLEVPPLKIHIDPGEATKEDIKNLLIALSNLQRAYGGSGLEIKDLEINFFDTSEVLQ